MKQEYFTEVEIPQGIEVDVAGTNVIVKGEKGENERKFKINKVSIIKKENKILIGSKKATKKEKRLANTTAAHIKNMLKGVKNLYEYKLKVCFSHFPVTVEIKDHHAVIKNFLGEKIPRKLNIPKNVEVKVDKDVITVTSINKELAGQAAANFEKATRITLKDRRVFQDGIFITSKAGKEM